MANKKNKKKCSWCDKEFTPTVLSIEYCSTECSSSYNNYLVNDNTERPLDKYHNNQKH